ncbi:MAG TPA: DUF4292 domain-containing protein [Candidatus Kapabacteria bacterium]|nr:DUF4292 domain-containing protein [Candidatus Kapabacteria bacterium]
MLVASALGGSMLLAGCAGPQKTTTTRNVTIDRSAARIDRIRAWLTARSLEAHSLGVTGDITVDQNGESNSGGFTLKDKRIDPISHDRIDSMSVEVTGPFGIKVARFLASPEQYRFYDILHGQTMAGQTDMHSLEDLTHLNGISLSMMSDLAYGLAPNGDRFDPSDSLELFSNGEQYTLVIHRGEQHATEALDLEGNLDSNLASSGVGDHSNYPSHVTLVRYRRWNDASFDPIHSKQPPIATIRYSEPALVSGMTIPQHIEALAGSNRLTLEYNTIQLNPSPLSVRIRMP